MSLFLKLLLCSGFVAVLHAKNVAEIRAHFMTLGVECTKDHPVSPEEMLQLHQHKVPDTPHVKCLLACIYRKVEWLDNKGMLAVDNAIKFIEKEHADDSKNMENSKKLFGECKKVNDVAVSDGDKGCERAALLAKCCIENAPKFGFELPI